MSHRTFARIAALLPALLLLAAAETSAQSPVRYRFSFPEPQHHWMAVEAEMADLPATPLELRMSLSLIHI